MSYTEPLNKKIISVQKVIFDVNSVYKTAKSALEDEKYDFVEKEQVLKNDQYGQQVNFEFHGVKNIDEFAKATIKIKFKFKDVEKTVFNGKNVQKGDSEIIIVPTVEIDYQNKFGKTKFNEFLFKIYQRYLKKKWLDDTYYEVIDAEVLRIYDAIKCALELYR